MAAGPALRTGADSTDLVFAEGGGTRAQAVRAVLGAGRDALFAPVVLGGFSVLLGLVLFIAFGVGLGTVLLVLALVSAGEVLLLAPLGAYADLRAFYRVEFGPPAAPERLRFVRTGRVDPWLPVSELSRFVIVHRIQEPYPGDRRPAAHTYDLRMVLRHNQQAPSVRSRAGDPTRLAEELKALLAPAGVRVELDPPQRPPPTPAPLPLDLRRLRLRQLRRRLTPTLTTDRRRAPSARAAGAFGFRHFVGNRAYSMRVACGQ
ncbi:hypothetical protein ACFQ6N_15700 [Kitasatospora sp. NPDC056446]|uniref:hypothetical protein n=1 Tax=Kitasatospora sp. NPDC056446 TaxID=3345819 RepID=UPI0036C2E4B1